MSAHQKLFIDANVIVSVLNNEQPLFMYSSRILSLSNYDNIYKLYTTPTILAIAFYFASKKCGNKKAKEKIKILSDHMSILDCGEKEFKACFADKKVEDFEDGLQYYSAIHSGCTAIITEDKEGFYYSKLKTFTCKEFLQSVRLK
jgi:predicted nucleic acid-binding protein